MSNFDAIDEQFNTIAQTIRRNVVTICIVLASLAVLLVISGDFMQVVTTAVICTFAVGLTTLLAGVVQWCYTKIDFVGEKNVDALVKIYHSTALVVAIVTAGVYFTMFR